MNAGGGNHEFYRNEPSKTDYILKTGDKLLLQSIQIIVKIRSYWDDFTLCAKSSQ
jgi:hypothetical protein